MAVTDEPPPTDRRFRFPAVLRLRRGAEFRRVFARRCSVADDCLIVYGLPNGLAHCRLGLSVSRKVGNAVVRNHWKRLIREAFRHHAEDAHLALDIVVLPRREATPDWHLVQRSLPHLLRRLHHKLQPHKRQRRRQH